MNSRVTTAIAAAFLLLAPVAGLAASKAVSLTPYSQNFEGLVQSSPTALQNDGWLVFGNVFSPDHSTYYYGYGTYPAPNNSGAFCGIDFVTGYPPQGAQDLVVYSDYANGDQAVGNQIEANVFQQQTVGAGDVGSTWIFQFDAKMGNLVAPSTALAFIKTLDPNAGYATTNFLTLDMTTLPPDWSTHQISIAIGASLAGQILQFGFANTTTHYVASGVFYDNISFQNAAVVPTRTSTWGSVKALYR